MTKKVDVRGLSCPQPVLMVKKTIDAGETCFIVVASDPAAIGNLQRLADNNGFGVTAESRPNGDLVLRMKKK